MMKRLLIIITGALLAVTLLGCQDSYKVNIEAEHRKLSFIAEQEIMRGQSSSLLSLQAKTLHPAP